MKVLLLVSFLSTLLITMCSGDKLEDFLRSCRYPSGCLQLRENAYCISTTHPYGYNPLTKTCNRMSRIGCGYNTCNAFSTLEDCKKKCSSL
uniref:Pancreatic trypsin inhibitor n=1 Tax=Rhipicephalus zambeziensis TaxID=60191 RepID=A0A224YD31_9ACAR